MLLINKKYLNYKTFIIYQLIIKLKKKYALYCIRKKEKYTIKKLYELYFRTKNIL
jgi:hypothetical protein